MNKLSKIKPFKANNKKALVNVCYFTASSGCQFQFNTLLYFIMILLSIYIYNWIGNKFLQLTSPFPYKYINSIKKTYQMTANVQAISIIISKLSKIMSN